MNAAVDLSKRPGCAAAAAGARYRVVLAELSAAGAQNRAAELARVDQLRAALPDLDAAEDAAVGLAIAGVGLLVRVVAVIADVGIPVAVRVALPRAEDDFRCAGQGRF